MSCPKQSTACPAMPSSTVRWNYIAHLTEGGLFMSAMALLNAQTVLPPIVEKLGGPVWLISLVPVLLGVGLGLPALVVAHRIDRLERFKPLVLLTGICQRLPYLLAGVVLLAAPHQLTLAIAAVALAPFLNGLMGGVGLLAWQQLVVKTVPANRRSSLFAIRNSIGCVCGLLAGGVIAAVLNRWPGTVGYGLLHLFTFVLLVGSLVAFSRVREIGEHPPREEHAGLFENLRHAAGMLRGHRELQLLVGVRVFLSGQFVLTPFLSIHALATLGEGDNEAFLGTLVVFQMLGGIAGNVVGALVGDRRSPRHVAMIGAVSMALVAGCAMFPASKAGFLVLFAGLGFAFNASNSSLVPMTMDLLPPRRRSTFLALLGVVSVGSMLAASGVAALLKSADVPFAGIALAAAGALVVATVLICLLPGRAEASPGA